MRARYQDIYATLRAGIVAGDHPAQSLLPTEAELCERFCCSHSTVRRALSELAQDGFVQPRQGRGVTVIWQPGQQEHPGYVTSALETFPEHCAKRGLTPKTELVAFERFELPEELAQASGLPAGTPVVHMGRLRLADGEPVALEDTYTSELEVPGITPEIARSGTYSYIEEVLGVEILTCKRFIDMVDASDEDARLLKVEPGSPLPHITTRTFSSTGRQFEYANTRQIPSFFQISLVAQRPRHARVD